MKYFLSVLAMTLPVFCMAETVVLKDGTKFESIETTENDKKLSIHTKYGNYVVNKADVENLEALGFENESQQRNAKTDGREFISELLPDGSVQVQYFFKRKKIGTQFFTPTGTLQRNEGKIMDGTYKEFYPDGKLKKEKTVIDEQDNGAFKTFYPNGTTQSEAYFVNGKRNGGFKIYTDSGKLIAEKTFVNGIANGYFREFDENGAIKSQIQYKDGEPKLAAKPPSIDPKVPEYKPMQEYKPVQDNVDSGLIGKNKSYFIEGEFFTIGGANKEWENNFNEIMDWATANFYYANGNMTTYPGIGVTAGVNMASYNSSPFYLAASYAKGPSAELDGNVVDYSARSGNYTEELKTYYYRLLLGYKFVMPIRNTNFFILDVNAGFGGGSINSTWAYSGAAFIPTAGSSSESWTGLTWSVGPTISWEHPGYVFELGGRYTVFPELKGGDNFADVKWKPFSIKASIMF